MVDKDFEMATEQWNPIGRLDKVPGLNEVMNEIQDELAEAWLAQPENMELRLQEDIFREWLNSPENRMLQAMDSIKASDRVYYDTIKYGQLVSAAMLGGSFSPQCKVHFFNKRGVLIGNLYEFIPYERLRLHHKGVVWERIAMGKKNEKLRQWTYETLCRVITILLRITQQLSR